MNKRKIKSLLFASISMLSISANAQIEKGTVFIGGRSSFSTSSSSASSPLGSRDSKSTGFSIEPQAGYYVSKNWAIGLGLNVRTANSTTNDLNSVTTDFTKQQKQEYYFGFNFLARYNKTLSKRFAFFVNGTLSTGIWNKEKNTTEQKTGPTTISNTTINEGNFGESPNFNLDIRPGVTYFVTPKLGIEATFASIFASYGSSKATASNQNIKSSAFNLGYNLYPAGFALGVHYYFAPKPKKQATEETE
ncbi:MAG: outer membrane beta-barrel protein [Bacteroidota bacterium]